MPRFCLPFRVWLILDALEIEQIGVALYDSINNSLEPPRKTTFGLIVKVNSYTNQMDATCIGQRLLV